MNDLCSQLSLQISRDPETEGLDLQASQTWIYPTNYPIRDYQYNIIQKALLNNTLVSLPTGLGKTFIAAVVMYNYFRWYPLGKIIFMAPTRPLVKQQVDACYDIMGIPKEATAELTGTKASISREDIWQNKRVFFITPQILQNDLDRILTLGNKIKCLVFDEAHKARGNHAYCEVIRKLQNVNKYYRVLALSATPGGTINDVLEVIHNLLISHLEFRTEESQDVSRYVFERNLTTIVVPLGEKLQQIKDDYLQILDYYTRTLIKYKVIHGNCASLTKGKIYMTLKNFQQSGRSAPNYAEIMKNLNICVTLYHGFELLVRHGLRSFATFFEEHKEKPLLRGNHRLLEIIYSVNEYLGPKLKLEPLPDGNFSEVPKDIKFGHPKFYKLRDILVNHFQEKSNSSRVIVFFEYRDSVMEAYGLLRQSAPLLKPRIFLGQKNGITQRSQLNVIKAFRDGYCNILLSTSIGEEGLDVGDVDLIICFDISNKSPIRMVQRMGRTGRKKEGNIIVLVTEGKEQQTLKDCLIHKNNVTYHVLQSTEISRSLNTNCPKMLLDGILPRCEKIYITVKKPVLNKNCSVKDMFKCMSARDEPIFSEDLELIEMEEKIPKCQMLWPKANFLGEETTNSDVNILGKKISKQRSFQKGHRVQHSKDTEILVTLLQFADSKRFNIPTTQIGTTSYNAYLKQTDIRQLFLKSQTANDFDIPSTPIKKVQRITSGSPGAKDKLDLGPEELFTEISSYLSIKSSYNNKCRHCPKLVDCEKFTEVSKPTSYNWVELDCSIFTNITINDLAAFKKSLITANHDVEPEFDDSLNFNAIQVPSQISQPPKVLELEDLIDKSILTEFFNKSFHFEPPKSLNKLLNDYSISIIEVDDVPLTGLEQSKPITKKCTEQEQSKPITKKCTEQELLTFFKLKSLSDIFEEEHISISQKTIIYSESPDIFGDSPVKLSKKLDIDEEKPNTDENLRLSESNASTSPILGSVRSRTPRTRKPNLQNLKRNFETTVSASAFTMNSTQISSTPLSSKSTRQVCPQKRESVICTNKNKEIEIHSSTKLADFSDFCDLSMFGIHSSQPTLNKNKMVVESPASLSKIISLSDSCNEDDFCQTVIKDNSVNVSFERVEQETLHEEEQIKSKYSKDIDTLADICDVSFFLEPSTSKENKSTKVNLDASLDKLTGNKENIITQTYVNKQTKENSYDLDKTVDNLVPYSKKSTVELDLTPDNLMPFHKEELVDYEKTNCDSNELRDMFVTVRKKKNQTSIPKIGKLENISGDMTDNFKMPLSNVNKTPNDQKTSLCLKRRSSNLEQSSSTQNHSLSQLSITQMLSFINKEDSGPSEDIAIVPSQPKQNLSNRTNGGKLVDEPTMENSQRENNLQVSDITDDFFNFSFNCKKTPLKKNKLMLNKPKSSQNQNLSQITSKKPMTGIDKSHNVSFKRTNSSDDDFKPKSPASPVLSRSHDISVSQSNSSDDDFEPKPITSPAWSKPKSIRKLPKKKASVTKNSKKTEAFNGFIENEAVVSEDENVFVSEDEADITLDHYDKSFVADDTHHVDTQMHAVYLQSVRSPVIRKLPRKNRTSNVYSQEVNIRPEEESYLDDSFVVHEEDIESNDELSQLEILEMRLEQQNKRKLKPTSKIPAKRRRIIEDFSDDSG